MIGNGWTLVQSASAEPSGQFVPGAVTVAVLTTVPSGVDGARRERVGGLSVTMSKAMSAPAREGGGGAGDDGERGGGAAVARTRR